MTVREDESAMLWDKLAFLAPFALLTTRHQADVAPYAIGTGPNCSPSSTRSRPWPAPSARR